MSLTALVMAGGAGTRMRATHGATPKPLVRVAGITLLEHNLRALLNAGLRRILVSVNAGAGDVRAFVAGPARALGEPFGTSVLELVEAEPLGNIGIAGTIEASDLLVVYADNLTLLDLRALVASHRQSGAALTLAAHQEPFRLPYGELRVEHDRVTAYEEKPARSFLVCSALSVLAAPALTYLRSRGRKPTGLSELARQLIADGQPVHAFQHAAPWVDVNDAASLAQAEALVEQHPDAFPHSALAARASLQDVRVALTGAGGFVGSAIARRLVAAGASVTALLGPPGAEVRATPGLHGSLSGEITDTAVLERVVRGAAVVVHAAGLPSVAHSFEAPAAHARVHVAGTAAVTEACRAGGVRRLVHVSSAEVYGQPACNPVAEDAPAQPRSPYAAVKLGAEAIVDVMARAAGFEAVILRPFSLYGPGAPPYGLVSRVLRQVLAGDGVEVFDERPTRDYCYVDDAADAVARACGAALDAQVVLLNLGSGTGTSVGELVAHAAAAAGREVALRVRPHNDRPASLDIHTLIADVRAARRALGWTAGTTLTEGLRRSLDAMRMEVPA